MPRDGGRVGVSGRWPTAIGFDAGGDVFGRSDGTSGAGGIGEPRITTDCGGGFTGSATMGRFAGSGAGARFTGSGLFAYKVNWQTVFYLGYSDDHRHTELTGELEPFSRGAFAKVSYAWQK